MDLEELLNDIDVVNGNIFRIIEGGALRMQGKELEHYAILDLCNRFLSKVQDELKAEIKAKIKAEIKKEEKHG